MKTQIKQLIKEFKSDIRAYKRKECIAKKNYDYEEASYCRCMWQTLDYVIQRLQPLS
jgi:hypothetical protein